MLGDQIYILFYAMAAVFGGMALKDYFQSGRQLRPAAKTWRRMAIAFFVFGSYLLYTNW